MKVILVLLLFTLAATYYYAIPIEGGLSGYSITTRYWDCCKPTCSWAGNTPDTDVPLASCGNNGYSVIDGEIESGCIGGDAYICTNQHGYPINDTFAIGFVAASFNREVNLHMCCACVSFKFRGDLSHKQMILQVTNTGTDDLHGNEFDIAIPGGGVGYYDQGCMSQWGEGYSWGQQYGGVDTAEECLGLPEPLQSGCMFRFDWMEGVSNPDVDFVQVECPADLINMSGCSVKDE